MSIIKSRKRRRCRIDSFDGPYLSSKYKAKEFRVKNWENNIRILADDLCISDKADEVIERAKKNSSENASSGILYEKARMYLIRMV